MNIRRVLLLALVLRVTLPILVLLFTKDVTLFHSLDTSSYIEMTPQLIDSQAASQVVVSQRFDRGGVPDVVRTPGYPLLLVPGVLLGNTELVTVALQILLSCFTVYLVYRVALLLFGRPQTATLCAFLLAIEPLSILYASKLLTETLFTVLVISFLYCILSYYKSRSLGYLAASALLLAGATYVRPISYYFPVVMAAILLVWALATKTKRRSIAQFAAIPLFLLLAMGPLGLWQLRNVGQADYHGFSAIADINWYFYQGVSVLAEKEGVPYYELWGELGYLDREQYMRTHPERRNWSEGRLYETMGREGREIVSQNLPIYGEVHLKGMFKTLVDPGGVEYLKLFNLYPQYGGQFGAAANSGFSEVLSYMLRENQPLLLLSLLFGLMLVVYLLSASVALFSKRLFSVSMATAVVLGLYLWIMSGGPQSLNRFRHPIMPIVCVLSGYGLTVIIEKIRGRSTRESRVTHNDDVFAPV